MSKEAQIIYEMIKSEISDSKTSFYTQFPANIVSYDNQLATVKPTVNIRFSDGDVVELGTIANIPVIFPAGGGGIMSFPLKVGDPVWVECSMLALDQWKESYQTSLTPDTKRMHSLTDAVCIPQVFPKNIQMGVSNENVEILFNKVNPENKNVEELLSSFKMLPDGSLSLGNKFNSNISFGEDKSVTIENTDSGASVKLLDDGNIEITTAATIKIQNSGEELINLISEFIQTVADNTVNTIYGASPMNLKPQMEAIKTRLDTLKA